MIKSFPCSSHNLFETGLFILTFIQHIFIVIQVDGLFSWGYNDYGQLGLGNTRDHNDPQRIDLNLTLDDHTMIGCGGRHTIISTNEGMLSWGDNSHGQLGLGHNNANQNKPQMIELKTEVILVSCGWCHSMVLTSDGIYTWGANEYGQLGLGHNADQNKPQKIDIELKEVTSISCGCDHSMILALDGVYTWGANEYGQLGLGHNTDQNSPKRIEELKNEVKFIVCGGNHSIILKKDGSLFSWGSNSFGQLGHNESQNQPSKIEFDFGEIVSIGCGYVYSIVSSSNGFFSWGGNGYGQLGQGNGDYIDHNNPQRMKLNKFDISTSIYCCGAHSIIISSEGIFSWGRNPGTPYTSIPQLIPNGKNMKMKSEIRSLVWELQGIIWTGKFFTYDIF